MAEDAALYATQDQRQCSMTLPLFAQHSLHQRQGYLHDGQYDAAHPAALQIGWTALCPGTCGRPFWAQTASPLLASGACSSQSAARGS